MVELGSAALFGMSTPLAKILAKPAKAVSALGSQRTFADVR